MRAILLPLITAVFLSACANDREPLPKRNLGQAVAGAALASRAPTLAILPPEGTVISACAALGRVADSAGTGPKFQYLGALYGYDYGWFGAIELDQSPFTQMVLGEQFSAGDEAAFYEKARKEHEAGRLGAMQWFVVNFMKKIGLLSVVQFKKTNEVLEETFPGIFGARGPMEKSLAWKLANRAAVINDLRSDEAARILTRQLPLFPVGGWDEFAAEVRENLTAAIAGLTQNNEPRENLCGFVLLQHNFAQLLRLKGFNAPVTKAPIAYGSLPHRRLEKLSASAPEFPKQALLGSFTSRGRAIVLESENISQYDPARAVLGVTQGPPGSEYADRRGGLSEALAMMEGLLYSFQASSPASPWVKERGTYWYGDVQAENGPAMLPAEAHALSLGLLTLHFKNMAFRHIRKISATGRLLKDGEAAAGFVLDANGEGSGTVRMRVGDLARLTRVSTQLVASLDAFFQEPAGHWEALNPVYNHQLLEALLGKEFFRSGTPGPAAATPLRDSLISMRFPLAMLLVDLGGNGRCVAELDWNLNTGEYRPARLCTVAEKTLLVETLRNLAAETGSSLLLNRANEIARAP